MQASSRIADVASVVLLAAGIVLFVAFGVRRVLVDEGSAGAEFRSAILDGAARERPTLVYLFRPEDCSTYRWMTERWNVLHRQGVVDVIGIPVALPGDSAARQKLLDALAFPVRPELAAAAEGVVMAMGYRRTPLSILLDSEGRPRVVVPARPPAHDFVAETELIRSFASVAAGATPPRREE